MARIHKSVEIKAPIEKVYTYLDDPRKSPEWITNMIEVNDVKGSGTGAQYKWAWKMAGMKFQGENTNIEDVPNKRIVVKSKGGIDSTWDFKLDRHENVTTLDLDVDYSIPVPVLGKLAENLILKRNDRDLDTAMMNLKDKLET